MKPPSSPSFTLSFVEFRLISHLSAEPFRSSRRGVFFLLRDSIQEAGNWYDYCDLAGWLTNHVFWRARLLRFARKSFSSHFLFEGGKVSHSQEGKGLQQTEGSFVVADELCACGEKTINIDDDDNDYPRRNEYPLFPPKTKGKWENPPALIKCRWNIWRRNLIIIFVCFRRVSRDWYPKVWRRRCIRRLDGATFDDILIFR